MKSTMVRKLVVIGFLLAMVGAYPGLNHIAHAEGRTVTVATFDEEPFVFSLNGVKTGFTVDLLDAVGAYRGWNMVYQDEAVANSKGLLDVLAAGRADVAATSITITAERLRAFDFTQPTLESGTQIVVAADRAEPRTPGLADFLTLLSSKTMLVWIGAALVLSIVPAHIIWLLERGRAGGQVSRSYFPGVFQALKWGLNKLLDPGYDDPPAWQSRILGVLWAFIGIAFVAFFTATLTANLTVEQIEERISSPSDLAGNKICAPAGTTTAKYLSSIGLKFDGVRDIAECYTLLKEGKTDAMVGDAALMEYWVAHGGRGVGRLAGPVLNPDTDGIACRIDDPTCHEIDEALIALRESGAYQLIKDKWFSRPDSE